MFEERERGMKDSTRAFMAIIAIALRNNINLSSILDYSLYKRWDIHVILSGEHISAHYYDDGTQITGSLNSGLYDYRSGQNIRIQRNGSNFTGYLNVGGTSFSIKVNGRKCTLYENETGKSYQYSA
ncbi:hypothetical protein [Bartonella apis]|uniref:hypothetical protein n=1 Tax=Bartonella apis TaxID=1686310 RepID=UPI00242AFAFB|nr:hypothetical protein [Bartonella apis]